MAETTQMRFAPAARTTSIVPQIHAANREPRDGCMRRGPVAAASVLAFFGSTAGKMILARVQELNIKPTSEKAAMAATTKGLLPEKRLC